MCHSPAEMPCQHTSCRLTDVLCSAEVAEVPSMQQLMQDGPQLAQRLMITMANPKKRKRDDSK